MDQKSPRPLRKDQIAQLNAVMSALEAYRKGEPIEARCPVCGQNLTVTIIPEIGSTVVSCQTGCTVSHMKWDPKPR